MPAPVRDRFLDEGSQELGRRPRSLDLIAMSAAYTADGATSGISGVYLICGIVSAPRMASSTDPRRWWATATHASGSAPGVAATMLLATVLPPACNGTR
jgi:hypothetical protein